MVSQELLRKLTQKHNAYLRHNLTVVLTSDPLSLTNVPRSNDCGVTSHSSQGLSLVNGEVEIISVNRRRLVTKSKVRRGVSHTTISKRTVALNKASGRTVSGGKRVNRLRQVAARVVRQKA